MPGRARRPTPTGAGSPRSTASSPQLAPSPVVELNRAVAVAMASGPAAGLALVDALAAEPALAGYHLLPSVRGDLLAKLGRLPEAKAEFERAASLTRNAAERELLARRAAACAGTGASEPAPAAAHRAARVRGRRTAPELRQGGRRAGGDPGGGQPADPAARGGSGGQPVPAAAAGPGADRSGEECFAGAGQGVRASGAGGRGGQRRLAGRAARGLGHPLLRRALAGAAAGRVPGRLPRDRDHGPLRAAQRRLRARGRRSGHPLRQGDLSWPGDAGCS